MKSSTSDPARHGVPSQTCTKIPANGRARQCVGRARQCVRLFHAFLTGIACLLGLALCSTMAVGFGSLNNFDAVNDNGVPCHGFEIEIDGILARDITYTYDWNHYGVPIIREDATDPLHPRVWVRYQSAKLANGTWVAFTAVPSGPITPTDGHQFTNPAVNFGGEHFGVGFAGAPTAVSYHWLVDDGAGNLVRGTAVNIATPTFVYVAPQNNVPAQVQAVIAPPPPPAPPAREFGEPVWVKQTRTSSHNNANIELRDLVSDDPNNPDDRNWKRGEPDEVEVEWQLMQVEFNAAAGGKNGEIQGAPENLPEGDEVITRRYDFFKYIGPLDPETGEALAESVSADGLHGTGTKVIDGIETDLSTVLVVGAYIGAQMAGFDAIQNLGLIDHLQNGLINEPYIERTLIIGGTAPVVTGTSGSLPSGMSFNPISGIISGTPTQSGSFVFSIESTDAAANKVSRDYILSVLSADEEQVAHVTITVLSSPATGGTATGAGEVQLGTDASVVASANPGFVFVAWTEAGTKVSTSPVFAFTALVNRKLTAEFLPTYTANASAFPESGGTITGSGTYTSGETVSLFAAPSPGYAFLNWTDSGAIVRTSQSYTFVINADHNPIANFALTYSIAASSMPVPGGSVTGGGIFTSGSPVTLVATPSPGYIFVNWTEAETFLSQSPSLSFSASANRTLTANFAPATYTVSAAAVPVSGGSITGGGTFTSGSQVTLVANPNPGFAFVNWTEGTAVVSASQSLSFTVYADRRLNANFRMLCGGLVLSKISMASQITGGRHFEVELKLSNRAPKGGVWIGLSSSNPGVVRIPPLAFVRQGRSSVHVCAYAGRVSEPMQVEITATLGDSEKTKTICVIPRRISHNKD